MRASGPAHVCGQIDLIGYNPSQQTKGQAPTAVPAESKSLTIEGSSLEQVLDGVRTRWARYPVAAWQEAGISGQLLASVVRSPQLGNERTVLLYLPASYDTGQKRYPVVYMQDGQNLFDPATAFGGKTWRAGAAMTQLAA
ncbi:MAG: alpha/beta hydrolase-fold protein, partial [Caldilineaceae bacterium]